MIAESTPHRVASQTSEHPVPLAAWEETYRRHAPKLSRMLTHGLAYTVPDGTVRRIWAPTASDAEELCHEAFCELYVKWSEGSYDAARPVWPYLRRIAANLTLRRAAKATREHLVAEPIRDPVADKHHETAFDALARVETERRVSDFRDQLAGRERAVFDAYSESRASQREVGDQVGLSRDQVYRTLLRIRKHAMHFFGPALRCETC